MEPWVNFIQAYFIKLGHENDIFLFLFGSDRSSRCHNVCLCFCVSVRLCGTKLSVRSESKQSTKKAIREHSESTQKVLRGFPTAGFCKLDCTALPTDHMT